MKALHLSASWSYVFSELIQLILEFPQQVLSGNKQDEQFKWGKKGCCWV